MLKTIDFEAKLKMKRIELGYDLIKIPSSN